MKAFHLVLFLALNAGAGCLFALPGDISAGDRKSDVLEALGRPLGQIGSSNFQVYYFDRGEVTFRQGIVESHTLVSEEEAERRKADIVRQREERQERAREARERRMAKGRDIRDQKISDPNFRSLPATARLAFWNVFRQKYPEVDADLQYSVAYAEASLEQAERRAEAERDRRLRELELRVAQAEQQTRRAELEAQRARERRVSRDYYDSYAHYYHRSPIIVVSPKPGEDHKKPREKMPPPRVEVRPPTRHEELRERLQEERFMFPPIGGEF